MARGLAARVAPELLTIVVNVGDDAKMYGALVCADLDTVTYTLAGIEGPHGWGVANDSHNVMDQMAAAGVDTTFRLGDRDLAHCLARTVHIDNGGTLSEYTQATAVRFGIGATLLPVSDDPIRTKITTETGEMLDFQDYFVLRSQRDNVVGLEYRGGATALPAPGVIDAITSADVVVIAPSNPPLSIWPMLAIPDVEGAVRAHPNVVAVSPLIGGAAVKGPLVAVMQGLGLEPSTAGIVDAYAGLLSHLVIDRADSADAGSHVGVNIVAADILITDGDAAASLADILLDLA